MLNLIDSTSVQTETKKLRVAYLLCYRDPDYIRTHSLLEALKKIEDVELIPIINKTKNIRRYIESIFSLKKIINHVDIDCLIVGFRGNEIYWPARWIVGGKTVVIFDAMMSPYSALADESKHGLIGKLLAKLIFPIEKSILKNANLIITDTDLHVSYISRTFGVPVKKCTAIPVGARENIMPIQQNVKTKKEFNVLFYGSFLPLHGFDIIVKAASLLTDLPIRFDFIGGNKKNIALLFSMCRDYGVKKFTHRRWADPIELFCKLIPSADVCLGGPFGNTPQSRRVITGKTSQCLALGKVTIIGDIDINVGFKDKINCLLVPQGDERALASQIRWLFLNQGAAIRIGISGKKLYDETLSIECIMKIMKHILFK